MEKLHQPESKEKQIEFFNEVQNAKNVCAVVYDKMMTGNMSAAKAHEVLAETFIDSGLLSKMEESSVPIDLTTRISQIIADPSKLITLTERYWDAHSSVQNLFVGALGKLEGETVEWELEDSDKQEISKIMDEIREITHDSVIDMRYKNHFIGQTTQPVTKQGGVWKHVSIDPEKKVEPTQDVDMDSFEEGATVQVERHNDALVARIREVVLNIRIFLGARSSELPERVVEILKDLSGELKKSISSSIDDTKPSLIDYVGTEYEGGFQYTDLVAKEFKYRNFFSGKLT